MRLILKFILVAVLFEANAQHIWVKNRQTAKGYSIKTKKIKSVITLNGVFFEGRPKVKNRKLIVEYDTLSLEQIGILEVKKGSVKNVVSFPFKLLGIVSGAGGVLMTSAYVSDSEDEDAALGIVGASLIGIGIGSTIIGKNMAPRPGDLHKDFHVKDWEFRWQ